MARAGSVVLTSISLACCLVLAAACTGGADFSDDFDAAPPPRRNPSTTDGASSGSSGQPSSPVTDGSSTIPTDPGKDAAPDVVPETDACIATTPIDATASCASPTSYAPANVCARPELHFASVYEASSDHTKAYPATVKFEATGRGNDAVLVLSSYEGVNWTVQVGVGSALAKVIVLGYKASTVSVPVGVVVDNRTGTTTTRCSYNVSSSDSCVAYVKQSTGGAIGSMVGCYTGTSFTLK